MIYRINLLRLGYNKKINLIKTLVSQEIMNFKQTFSAAPT